MLLHSKDKRWDEYEKLILLKVKLHYPGPRAERHT